MLDKLKPYYCQRYLYVMIFMLLGYMAFQYHCQHRILSDSIKTYDTNIKLYQEKLDEVIEHHNEMFDICDSLIDIMDALPLGSPLDTLEVSSNYGWRKNPLGEGYQSHSGMDFLADWRDTIYATGAGIIEKSGHNHGYGRSITIKHISGYKTRYAHLTRYFVRSGDFVKKGQPIGTAGNTGETNGYHLHYEVSRHGELTNPKNYIRL